MKKVLHLSFAYGGGVVSAINSYVKSSPDVEHFLAADIDNEFALSGENNIFVRTYNVDISFLGLLRLVLLVRRLNPDYIHLHSSFAGAIGRILFFLRRGLIYTPHCYSFERRDISNLKRAVFLFMESILTLKPYSLAACSPRELKLGSSIDIFNRFGIDLNRRQLLINFSNTSKSKWVGGQKTVVMIGRICPQKSPNFFAKVAHLVRNSSGREIDFIWVGGGDANEEKELIDSGVKVTGWISSDNVDSILKSAGLYFHSALWEGCPMSVLEAARLRMPIVSRDIPSIKSIGIKLLGKEEADCANKIVEFFDGDKTAYEQCEYVNLLCSSENQEKALKVLYV